MLGIAFGEFSNFVVERALKGEPLNAALKERDMQIADRSKVSVSQRALTDSTAHVLATTAALRALLEQRQRPRVGALFGMRSSTLAQEERLRRKSNAEAFKPLRPLERGR